jgi:hypothetical protein
MKTEPFNKPHPFLSSGLTEMVVGRRYQYKEDSHIYHFIFSGWGEDEEFYQWFFVWDDGPFKGQSADASSLKDMTGMYYSGMPHFMPENTYYTTPFRRQITLMEARQQALDDITKAEARRAQAAVNAVTPDEIRQTADDILNNPGEIGRVQRLADNEDETLQ